MIRSVHPNGDEVRRLRSEKCWTRAYLANEADVSEKTIENIENGKRVDRASLLQVAKAFRISVDRIKMENPASQDSQTQNESNARIDIEIRVSLPFESISGADQLQTFFNAIAMAAGRFGDVNVQSVRRGSTIISADLQFTDSIRLFTALCQTSLDALFIESVTYYPLPFMTATLQKQLLAIKREHDINDEITIRVYDQRTPQDELTDREYDLKITHARMVASARPEGLHELLNRLVRERLILLRDGRPESIECVNLRIAGHRNSSSGQSSSGESDMQDSFE